MTLLNAQSNSGIHLSQNRPALHSFPTLTLPRHTALCQQAIAPLQVAYYAQRHTAELGSDRAGAAEAAKKCAALAKCMLQAEKEADGICFLLREICGPFAACGLDTQLVASIVVRRWLWAAEGESGLWPWLHSLGVPPLDQEAALPALVSAMQQELDHGHMSVLLIEELIRSGGEPPRPSFAPSNFSLSF